MITAAAIATLPEPLRGYFQRHQFYLVGHASDPDTLSRQDPREHVHHFTDADAYYRYPFARLRLEFVTEDRPPSEVELKNGDAIWQIDRLTLRLASDFRRSDWSAANHDAVFLAHYAADLTQPLHTTANYDGQQTGQNGIHARFETELVRMNADRWNLHSAPATAIPQLRQRIFSEFLKSYSASRAVFADDLRARAGRTYASADFRSAFSALAAPLAEVRLEDAANFVGSLWYTAWLKAGKPDLSGWPSRVCVKISPRRVIPSPSLSSRAKRRISVFPLRVNSARNLALKTEALQDSSSPSVPRNDTLSESSPGLFRPQPVNE